MSFLFFNKNKQINNKMQYCINTLAFLPFLGQPHLTLCPPCAKAAAGHTKEAGN